RRRLLESDSHPAGHTHHLEPADRFHDRRTLERSAPRRRLLRLGAPRYGKFLGISGSLAFAGGLHFRYGDLPHPVRRLPRPRLPLVQRGTSRRDGRTGGGDRLRAAEHRWREGGLGHLAVALLSSVVAISADHRARSV